MAAHLRLSDQLPLGEPINLQQLVKDMWEFRELSNDAAKVMQDRELWASMSDESQEKTAKDFVAYAHHAIGGVDIFQERRVFLDLLADHATLDQLCSKADVYHDFDSMHGASLDLPFTVGGNIMPVLDRKLVLDRNIHLFREIATEDDDVNTIIEMHKIPNIPFMSISERHITRIMLPYACGSDDTDGSVPKEIMAEVWKLIRPIIVEVQPSEDAYLPATFRMEAIRQVYAGTSARPLNNFTVLTIGPRIIEELRKKPFGREAFFLHQWRGTRGSTVHEHTEEAAVRSLSDFTACLDHEMLNLEDWTVDQGMTVMIQNNILLWRRDGLAKVVERIYHVDHVKAEQIVSSSQFLIDEEAQLDAAAGARHEPDRRTKLATGIHYFQVYHTSKEPTYNYPMLSYKQISKDAGAKHIKDLETIYKDAHVMTGGARLEIRIGLKDVGRFMMNIGDMADLLLNVPSSVMWGFKSGRAQSMLDLLKLWRNGTTHGEDRKTRSAIGLMMALIWAVNALNHRPKDMAGERALLPTLLPWLEGVDGVARPVREQGLLFFNGLLYSLGKFPIPRLSVVPNDWDMQRMLGNSVTLESLRMDLPTAIVTRRRREVVEDDDGHQGPITKRPRTNNKAKVTALARIPQDMPNIFLSLFDDFVDESDSSVELLLKFLHQIWVQFLGDMMEKIPYARSVGTYSTFPSTKKSAYAQKLFLQEQLKSAYAQKLFLQEQLHEVFRCCAVRTGEDVWEAAFNSCFPESGEYSKSAQGYDQSRWTHSWTTLKNKTHAVNFELMRNAVRGKWDELAWVSGASSSKMWNTGCGNIGAEIAFYNIGPNGPAPIILENPARPDCLKWRSAVAGATAWNF